MRLAYFILIHSAPEQFARLFRAIYDPGNTYLVHVDLKADVEVFRKIRRLLAAYPNAHLAERQNCLLCGWSLCDVELRGIRRLLELDAAWDYQINLSGACFPLVSQAEVRKFLDERPGANYIDTSVPEVQFQRAVMRTKYVNFELKTPVYSRAFPLPITRPYLRGCRRYAGSVWHFMTREFCKYLVSDPRARRIANFYKHTYCPEELFFQTAFMNSPFAPTLHNNYKRAIIFPDRPMPGMLRWLIGRFTGLPHSPATLTLNELPLLDASGALFGRKFDPRVDDEIIRVYERRLGVLGAEPATVRA